MLEWAGVAVWAIGNVGDDRRRPPARPLAQEPREQGKTARNGLWGWSRHPNYFFEWVNGAGTRSSRPRRRGAEPPGSCPPVLLLLLFRVTGIPATEAQALRSRADYAEYQRTTSVFVPLPPRRV